MASNISSVSPGRHDFDSGPRTMKESETVLDLVQNDAIPTRSAMEW
jgi:hypothetical protein